MGLLDHLWDDTLAGPRPDSGLGKLRKHNTFSFRPDSGKELDAAASFRSFRDDSSEETTKVTRKITIVKPPGYTSVSPPVSPAGSVTPTSPFSEGPFGSEERQRWSRMRKQAKLDQKAPILFKSSEI
ncbi:hypothetical protein MLD38_017826 [Melastoma candidum]|uniref:Uncharacterized protein n=1 Tax=Melastoma candidum TaxID=119954 RepID=A0ACB9QT14_9MYRT|nr:hypothetical protein MLD38_017826 [Melastoma candidum]